jgi:chromosome segregation ATPase
MNKKTTTAKTVTASVEKLLRENKSLAEQLEAALKRVETVSHEREMAHTEIGTLLAQVEGLEAVIAKDTEYHKQLKKALSISEVNRVGATKEAGHYKARLAMAESELFNVKTKLFAKIHEHEEITPNDHSALTAVLPALSFDSEGRIY